MKKMLKIALLTFLSIFPITELLENVERMGEEENGGKEIK